MAKRQRKYKIEIESVFGDTVTIEPPFSVDFDIQKSIQGNICEGTLTIYNLSPSIRSAIYKDLLQVDIDKMRNVSFSAGYEADPTLYSVFRGTVSRCYSYRQGVDFLTIIDFNSGSDYLANAYIKDIIPKGTTYRAAALYLANKIVNIGARAVGKFDGTFKRDTPVSGSVDKIIKDYCNGKFYIDDNCVVCINDNEYLSGVYNVINAESGLLGSPQKEETFITFDMIFEPRIKMGQIISLESQTNVFFNGNFRVVSFHHAGTISEAICGTAKSTIRVSTLSTDALPVSFE